LDQVRQRSAQWVAAFNRGDVDTCVAAYHPDAVMEAKPMGTFRGRAAIDGFWRPFLASGAGELVYRNIQLTVRGQRSVVLSADWSMNVGSGIITCELWVADDDGRWLLHEDAFEIRERV
ncbi:MAG: nuclear transport factor 2 family protein, partial [Myxococcota bacterium]